MPHTAKILGKVNSQIDVVHVKAHGWLRLLIEQGIVTKLDKLPPRVSAIHEGSIHDFLDT
jgi:hypothetical protein